MEYAGYKNYVCPCHLELADKMSGLKKTSSLAWHSQKTKNTSHKKTGKEIKRELQVIQEKKQSPLTVDDFLDDSIMRLLFQISGNCYYYIY